MNIAKHMEAIVVLAIVVLTSAASFASLAGKSHAADTDRFATLVASAKGVSATLDR